MSQETAVITLTQQQDYQFRIDFGGALPSVLGDEPPPLGQGAGPTPVQLLSAAVGNCLADSLLFALRKFKQQPEPLRCEVEPLIGRNADGRLRVLRIDATLHLGVPAGSLEHLDRALSQFEQFCTVTQSVGLGIPVALKVLDADGQLLKSSG